MRDKLNNGGFSLVEILVSLFVVSLAAVNISGLQKIISDQNRDNFSHTAVVKLVTDKFEEVMIGKDLQNVVDLNSTSSTHVDRGTEFTLTWNIETVSGAVASSTLRDVQLTVTWPDAIGDSQTFTYSEQISLPMLSAGAGGSAGNFPYTIPNLLDTTKVSYFENKMGYKKDAYVIYDSQLFHATSVHSVGNGQQRDIDPPVTYDDGVAVVSDGWESLGRIDNADLAELFID